MGKETKIKRDSSDRAEWVVYWMVVVLMITVQSIFEAMERPVPEYWSLPAMLLHYVPVGIGGASVGILIGFLVSAVGGDKSRSWSKTCLKSLILAIIINAMGIAGGRL